MNKINKKTLIIAIVIITFVVIYYINQTQNQLIITQENLETIESTQEENNINEMQEKEILIHIAGAVNKEGVISIQENKRVIDAIEKAGGLKENADISNINLADTLEDGTKIYIPTKEELKEIENQNNLQQEQTSSQQTTKSTSKININKANTEQLQNLPGIGPAIAEKIIEYRNKNGNFNKIEDIKQVSGIGESKYNKIKDLITIK